MPADAKVAPPSSSSPSVGSDDDAPDVAPSDTPPGVTEPTRDIADIFRPLAGPRDAVGDADGEGAEDYTT